MIARLCVLLVLVSAAACAPTLPEPSRSTLSSAAVGPSQPAIDELGPGEAEARAAVTDHDVRQNLEARRRPWEQLERMHEADAAALLALQKRFDKADVALTVLEARLAGTPGPAWGAMATKLARAETARRDVEVCLRDGLGSSVEWDQAHRLATAVASFELAIASVQ